MTTQDIQNLVTHAYNYIANLGDESYSKYVNAESIRIYNQKARDVYRCIRALGRADKLSHKAVEEIMSCLMKKIGMEDLPLSALFDIPDLIQYRRRYYYDGVLPGGTAEVDPTVPNWVKAITSTQISNWDTSFLWGDHSLAGYITAETDPTVPSYVKSISLADISNWDTAFGWGDHSTYGYLTSESDPTVGAHIKAITTTDISNWNTVFGDAVTGFTLIGSGQNVIAGAASNYPLAGKNALVKGIEAGSSKVSVVTAGGVDIEIDVNEANISHDNLSGVDANKHVDHSLVSISAGIGLTGGGDLTSSRTIALDHLGIQNLVDPNVNGVVIGWNDVTNQVEWVSGTSAIWGAITGTLSNQLDLQAALDNKEPVFGKNSAFNKDFAGTGVLDTVARSDHYHTVADAATAFVLADVEGGFMVPAYDWPPVRSVKVARNNYAQGQVTLTNGSPTILGVGTNFLSTDPETGLNYWWTFWVVDSNNDLYKITCASIPSNTSATISRCYSLSQVAGGGSSFTNGSFAGVSGTYDFILVDSIAEGDYAISLGINSYADYYGIALGYTAVASGYASFVGGGYFGNASGEGSFVAGGNIAQAVGSYSFAGGKGYSNAGGMRVPYVNGTSAFGYYEATVSQTNFHGVNAANAAILGGLNHNIPSTSPRSAILGGNTIKADASAPDTVFLPKVRIGRGTGGALTNDNTLTRIAALDATTGEIKWRNVSTIGWQTTGSTDVSSPIINADGANNSLTFSSIAGSSYTAFGLATNVGGTATTWSLSHSDSTGADSVVLNFDLDNLASYGAGVKFIDLRTTPTGIEYYADYSSSFTARSLVDKGYVDSLIGTGFWPLSGSFDLLGDVYHDDLSQNGYFLTFHSDNGGQEAEFEMGVTVTMRTWNLSGDTWPTALIDLVDGGIYIETRHSSTNALLTSLSFRGLDGSDTVWFQDNRATKVGIQYHDDYSADFTARSLVDKGYVDSISAGAIGGSDTQIQYNNGGVLGGATAYWDDINNRLGIGITAPDTFLHVSGDGSAVASSLLRSSTTLAVSNDNSWSEAGMYTASATAAHRSILSLTRSKGTLATPTTVGVNDQLGGIVVSGFDGTNDIASSEILFYVDNTVSTGSVPIAIGFDTGSSATRTRRMRINSNGRIVMYDWVTAGANLDPISPLYVSAVSTLPAASMYAAGDTGGIMVVKNGYGGLTAVVAGSNDYDRPTLGGNRSRGTVTSPTAVALNDELVHVLGRGYDGTNIQSAVGIVGYVDGAVSAGNVPGRLSFVTTPTGTAGRLERFVIKSDGKIWISTLPSAGDASDVLLLRDGTNGEITQLGIGTNLSVSGGNLNASGGGATTFDSLTDTPASKTANYLVAANSGGTALEYVAKSSIVGNSLDTEILFNNAGVLDGMSDFLYTGGQWLMRGASGSSPWTFHYQMGGSGDSFRDGIFVGEAAGNYGLLLQHGPSSVQDSPNLVGYIGTDYTQDIFAIRGYLPNTTADNASGGLTTVEFIAAAFNSPSYQALANRSLFQFKNWSEVVLELTPNSAFIKYPLTVNENSVPGTPATGKGVIYEKTDKKLYFKNDAGTEYDLTASGGVTAVGTPLDNQIAVWASASTIDGDADFTWDGTTFSVRQNTNGVAQTLVAAKRYSGGAAITLQVDATNSAELLVYNAAGTNTCILRGTGTYSFGASTAVTSGYIMELFGSNNKGRAADWYATSDIRLKENIKPYGSVLDKVKRTLGLLNTYNRIGEDRVELGFIAQDMLEIFPEIVGGSEEEMYDISYGRAGGIALVAVAELEEKYSKKIERLEDEIYKLKKILYKFLG